MRQIKDWNKANDKGIINAPDYLEERIKTKNMYNIIYYAVKLDNFIKVITAPFSKIKILFYGKSAK